MATVEMTRGALADLDRAKTLDEAGHELATVVIEIHREPERGAVAEAGRCVARFDGEPDPDTM